jgi:hypothetical protein
MPEDLTPVEAALARFAPAAARLDRDALMYAAGGASAKPSRLWPAAAAGFAMLAMFLGARIATMGPRVVEQPIYVHVAEPDLAPNPGPGYESDGSRYDDLLRRTSPLGELPPTGGAAGSSGGVWSAPLRPTLEHDLNLPPGSLRDVGPRSVPSPNS